MSLTQVVKNRNMMCPLIGTDGMASCVRQCVGVSYGDKGKCCFKLITVVALVLFEIQTFIIL